jgi:hypothetical protein
MSNECELGTMLRLVSLEFQDLELQRWQAVHLLASGGTAFRSRCPSTFSAVWAAAEYPDEAGSTERNSSRLPADNLAPKQRLEISHLDS